MEDRQPILEAANSRRAIGGFFLSGVLFSFSGAILPAWGYHLKSDYLAVGLYFLFLTFGIYAGSQICRRIVPRTGLRGLLIAGCVLATAGFIALAFLSGPQPASFRMFAMLVIGIAGATLNTGLFHALTPIYEHDKAATINLSGGMFGLGCLATAVLVTGTIEALGPQSILLLLAVIPAYFAFTFWRRGPIPFVPRPERSYRELLADFKSPGAILFTLLLFFQFGNEWAIAGWLPLFLIQSIGTSPSNGLLLLCFYWASLLVGRFAAQALLPNWGHTRMLWTSVLAALFGCFLVGLTEKLGGAVVGISLVGAGFASIYPLTVADIEHRFPYYHPGFFGGIFSLGLVGGLLTPSVLGFVAHEWGIGKVMIWPALGSLMVAVLVLLIWLEAKLSKPAEPKT